MNEVYQDAPCHIELLSTPSTFIRVFVIMMALLIWRNSLREYPCLKENFRGGENTRVREYHRTTQQAHWPHSSKLPVSPYYKWGNSLLKRWDYFFRVTHRMKKQKEKYRPLVVTYTATQALTCLFRQQILHWVKNLKGMVTLQTTKKRTVFSFNNLTSHEKFKDITESNFWNTKKPHLCFECFIQCFFKSVFIHGKHV